MPASGEKNADSQPREADWGNLVFWPHPPNIRNTFSVNAALESLMDEWFRRQGYPSVREETTRQT